ncbi:MAG: FHA domain-containing protein [Nitrospinae bacterium]|nr:FHA domain-containing protein [Nitrospinota bacterium]
MGDEDSRLGDKSEEIDLETLLKQKEKLESLIHRKFTKDITVMFTDLTGSTRLSEELGDLAMRSLLKNHYDIVTPIVKDNQGILVKTMGDGTMSYFDNPSDAVRAAGQLQIAMRKFNEKAIHPQLLLRCGLNTGRGIVEKNDVYGDVVNTAQRFEALAKPNEILISEDTFNLVRPTGEFRIIFSCETSLKGKLGPQKVYKVIWSPEQEAKADEYKTTPKIAVAPAVSNVVTSDVPIAVVGSGPPGEIVKLGGQGVAKLVVEEKGHPPRVYDLSTAPVVIGRAADAEIHLDESYVSRKHAKISYEDGKYFIEDLHSHIGTTYHGERINRREMHDSDEFFLGTVKLIFKQEAPPKPVEFKDAASVNEATMAMNISDIMRMDVELEGVLQSQYDITPQPVVIGRTQEADIRLDNPLISRRHVRIYVKGGKAVVEDLKSNNGTFLNGQKIEKAEASIGDEVRVGPYLLRLVNPMQGGRRDEESIMRKVFSFLKKG